MERWKDIQGYEGLYQISDHGNVKSLSRKVPNNSAKGYYVCKEIIMKLTINPYGYSTLRLHNRDKGKQFFVHKLVAEHFIENPLNRTEVNHIDHNKLNAHYTNLEWCTRKENMDAMVEFYGLQKKKYYCKHCQTEVYRLNDQCPSCSSVAQRKVERPSKEALLEEIKSNSFLALGKKYGVSDNAIRQWCKQYGLPYRKKDIKNL